MPISFMASGIVPTSAQLAGSIIDLWFSAGQYFGVSAPTDVLSISRASTGYAKTAAGTLTSFGTNTLRITTNGLLIEDARTNVIHDSQAISAWSVDPNGTVLDNQIAAPDGTTTASKMTANASVFVPAGASGSLTVASSDPVTVTFYAKAGTGDWALITAQDGTPNTIGSFFNITTGALGSTFTQGTGVVDSRSIEALANGWYRLIVTGHLGSSGSMGMFTYIGVAADGGRSALSGNFSYGWGAQFEAGAFASSYIPTTSTSVTRAADAVLCISNLKTILTTFPFSVLAQVQATQTAANTRIIGEASTNDDAILYINSNTSVGSYSSPASSQVITATLGSSLTFSGNTIKTALGISSTARSIVGAGGTVATDSPSGLATIPNPILGDSQSAGTEFYGYYSRLAAWNFKLADASLQGFTVP